MGRERDYASGYDSRNPLAYRFRGGSKRIGKKVPRRQPEPLIPVDENFYTPGEATAQLKRMAEASMSVKTKPEQQQQLLDDGSYEVAFVPAIPVVVIGGFVLVAVGASLLLQIEDENGELVTVNEYASRPIADLMEAITNDIRNYYQTEAKDKIAEIRSGVSQALNKIVVREEPSPQVYTTPNGEQKTPEHTGHAPPEVETRTRPTDIEQKVETQRHTGHGEREQQRAEDFVMETRISKGHVYRKNAAPIPANHQVHHLIPDASAQQSQLAMEAIRRGQWEIDGRDNLQSLPSTQDAYDKSPVKIRHRGSHGTWNRHAVDVLRDAETDLRQQYGSIQNVPDNVLEQTMNDVETDLRNDLNNINKGKRRGWIQHKNGMDKLSKNETEDGGAIV